MLLYVCTEAKRDVYSVKLTDSDRQISRDLGQEKFMEMIRVKFPVYSTDKAFLFIGWITFPAGL